MEDFLLVLNYCVKLLICIHHSFLLLWKGVSCCPFILPDTPIVNCLQTHFRISHAIKCRSTWQNLFLSPDNNCTFLKKMETVGDNISWALLCGNRNIMMYWQMSSCWFIYCFNSCRPSNSSFRLFVLAL